ncbi:uncharacterized protein BO97DRAFT_143248 [Aspergillus homomorphus CBS 101889]|uniref:DUF676 domain-containing protein n=1 Tax=Aspergillus homomorphus (strain CBS 101889) TaxID=1450537 RepID=A0A395HRM8_ASPHC|nr:hypothetical protein BO97DRAFT_143248 [Aspergillus homomorphus CBS 101889]RAL10149.1 hypothetical protein BO97DRAFT_143248 [Aspergillus homomorphus CBS 101889]
MCCCIELLLETCFPCLQRRSTRAFVVLTPPGEDDIKTRLFPIHVSEQAEFDLIAVHGWKGHRENSWTSASGINWLRDLLPKDIPKLNIYSWGYTCDRDIMGWSRSVMQILSRRFVADLQEYRESSQGHQRPLVVIAHSVGGIMLKSTLLNSASFTESKDATEDIKSSIQGILYMGTREVDASITDLEAYLARGSRAHPAEDEYFRESSWLINTLRQYEKISQGFRAGYGYERGPDAGQRHVEETSNARSMYFNTTWDGMIKYDSATDPNYTQVRECILWILKGNGEGNANQQG